MNAVLPWLNSAMELSALTEVLRTLDPFSPSSEIFWAAAMEPSFPTPRSLVSKLPSAFLPKR